MRTSDKVVMGVLGVVLGAVLAAAIVVQVNRVTPEPAPVASADNPPPTQAERIEQQEAALAVFDSADALVVERCAADLDAANPEDWTAYEACYDRAWEEELADLAEAAGIEVVR